MTALYECTACRRGSRFRKALWYRSRNGQLNFAGWYGRACFYRVAKAYADDGFAIQHGDGKPVVLRGGW